MALILESWIWLFYFDVLMRLRGFASVHHNVHRQQVAGTHRPGADDKAICRAMDLACVFYWKRVLCLQRSAATAVLLKRAGWNAEMVIGAQLLPFQSHAWVEIQNRVVNDKSYVTDMFQVLERC